MQQPLTVAHDSRSSCSALGAAQPPLADPSQASATGQKVSQGLAVVWGRGSSRAMWFPSSRRLARAREASAGFQEDGAWGQAEHHPHCLLLRELGIPPRFKVEK